MRRKRALVNPGQLKKVGAIPVVSPIVAPILGPGQTTTPANPPAQTPSQPQPPANGGGNPNPSPGNPSPGNPGNRASSPNSPSSPSNPGSGTGTPGTSGGGNPGSGTGTPSGGSPGSGTGVTGTSSGGNPGTGTGTVTTGTSGGGNPVPPGSVGTIPGTSSNGLPASVVNSTTINNGGETGVNSNSTSPTSGGSTPGVVVNAGNTPNNGVPNAGTGGGRSGSSISGTRSSGYPSDPSASATDIGTSSSSSGTRRGPVAAAIIVPILLLIIALVIFVLRRRSRARRDEQAIKWWFTRNRTSQSYGDNRNSTDGFCSPSRRSSFGTAIDHSSVPDVTIPPPPPMAEIGRPNGTDPALVLDLNFEQNRFSIGSANSHNSQFLVVHHRESLQPQAMKSYTESFSFPKPPGVDRSSLHSRGSERSRPDSPRKQGSPLSPISSTQDLEVLYVASPVGVAPSSLYPILAQPQAALITADPFADNNPFDDSALATVELKDAVEMVRRPFSPQLGDELQISVGEYVRVMQTFDDGWALVAKISSLSQGEVEDMQGLIPVDCLCEPDQTVDFGLKRTTSRGGVQNV